MSVLDQNDISTLQEELTALENNPVNGWDKIYPALYKALYETVHELSVTLSCPMPGLVVQCRGIQSLQASAYIMLDGTAQLHVGSRFMREYMLGSDSAQRSFKWVIAHELGHIVDPAFRKYGSKVSYTVRTTLNRFIVILTVIGTGYIFLNPVLKQQGLRLLVLSIGLFVVKTIFTVILHRSFEYRADKISLGACEHVDLEEVSLVLKNRTSAVRQELSQQFVPTNSIVKNIYNYVCKQVIVFNAFLLHPSIYKRIMRLKAIRN